jgi:hypothetical protein
MAYQAKMVPKVNKVLVVAVVL